ncbi:MAG: hypothetical protein FWC26_04585 [Fibromonadales bacterium]|nr:hypothetical protein [Fibromonadales bacterium]
MREVIRRYLPLAALKQFIEEAKANVSEEKVELYKSKKSRDYAENRLKELIRRNGGELTIRSSDGDDGYISGESISKLLSGKAVGKSIKNEFTREQHYAVASDIDNLYRNSTKIITHPDNKGRLEITAIQRRVAPLYGDSVAYITVREISKGGNKIYSIELIELGKLGERLEGIFVDVESTSTPSSSLPANNIENV